MAVHVDPGFESAELRNRLFAGDLVVMTNLPPVRALVDHAVASLTSLFAPHDPLKAHEHYSLAEMATLLGGWKPAFIHDARSKDLVCQIAGACGFDAQHTYFDVPKPRTSFPTGHLATGVAFAFPWHRDTWYGAPAQQINLWIPVLGVLANNAMGFDVEGFRRIVNNDSSNFDYYVHNAARAGLASQSK